MDGNAVGWFEIWRRQHAIEGVHEAVLATRLKRLEKWISKWGPARAERVRCRRRRPGPMPGFPVDTTAPSSFHLYWIMLWKLRAGTTVRARYLPPPPWTARVHCTGPGMAT